ncbi:sensor histidine kinase [Mesorhizobium sp. A556]
MPGKTPLNAGKAVSGGREDSGIESNAANSAHWRRSCRVAMLLAGSALAHALSSLPAHAQSARARAPISFNTVDVMQAAVFAGVMGAALLLAIVLIRERARIAAENVTLKSRLADTGASLQRYEAMLNLRDQRVVVWGMDNRKPELVGGLPIDSGAPEERAAFLAFGRWLTPRSAATLEHAIAALREKGATFDFVAETQAGMPLDVHGRKSAAQIMVRFVSLSQTQRSQARLKLENQQLAEDNDTMLGLFSALKMPVWMRTAAGRLKWVNRAYAQAVEAEDSGTAVREEKEFLGGQAREAIAEQQKLRPVFEQALSTVIEGDRRIYAVTDFNGPYGSAGLASDTSAVEAIHREYERTVRSHADTLDQLNTAVATFDTDEKLRFFNQAFQKLWGLDSGFLHSAPDNALLLDRLRSESKIAEQPEWRRWKETLLSAYRSVEPQEHWWHLPDGKTIRVVANPQPKGGVTWVFENLTEKIDLESRYQTAVRVQGETLDNLAEGVAVFGPDGRLRLSNPAFAALWGLDHEAITPSVHVSAIRDLCARKAVDSPWGGFAATITGFDEERRDRHGQTELASGKILSFAVIHLPNGQVMTTFVDVTDSVQVERALKDKNEALLKSDQLKNDFVQHVSYELRSPLTNIIGFTELLSLSSTGPLTQRQSEYVEHVGSSSAVLLTIVNDILDLATVDAGIMQLEISEVPVEGAIAAAAELVSDRLEEHAIKLEIDAGQAPKSFHGDEIRVRQILYNLLSNAANYAPEASTIRLACRQSADGVEFSVHDDGPGMSQDVLDSVFRRFEPRANGGRRRGAGLGLSIVKSFVELHGGSVHIETGEALGTTVVCTFPTVPAGLRAAAE